MYDYDTLLGILIIDMKNEIYLFLINI